MSQSKSPEGGLTTAHDPWYNKKKKGSGDLGGDLAGNSEIGAKMTAAINRDKLAKAFTAWRAAIDDAQTTMMVNPHLAQEVDDKLDEADVNLEAALLETQTIDEEDIVEGVDWSDGSILITLGTCEALNLDINGNITRGQP